MASVRVALCAVLGLAAAYGLVVLGAGGLAAQEQKDELGVVQVLVFEDQDLVTQGSGVYVDGSGSVATAAHLLRVYNQLFVVGADGERRPATLVKKSASDDFAILRVSATPDGGVSPVTFAAAVPAKSDVLRIEGYWSKGLEPERGWNLFGPERPDFKAAVQGRAAPVRGVVDSATDSGIVLLAAVGRGAYGGPAVNSCGRVVGLVNRGPSASDGDLWKPHVIEPRVAVLPSDRVVALLRDAGIEPSVAEKDCKAEVAAKTEESKKETEEAKKKAAAAEKKRQEAERQAKEAEKKAEEAEQEKDRAEKEAEQVKKDTAKAVEGLSERIGEKDAAIKAEQERRRQYMIYGAIAVGVLLLLSLLLWVKRRKDLRSAEAELDAANARFSDCLLEGMDSAGDPIALRISGRDLMKSANGVMFGRNPDVSDVVVADETVSRRHARLLVRDGALFLEDMGSTGGTRVNGEALAPDGGPVRVDTDDRVELGAVRLTLRILEE